MKRIPFCILITALIIAMFYSCQTRVSNDSVDADSRKALIEFEKRVLDFGLLNHGDHVGKRIHFTNVSDDNIYIKEVTTSCECTLAHFSDSPVKPDDKGYIEIELDTRGLIGRQFVVVTVMTNCGKSEIGVQAEINYN